MYVGTGLANIFGERTPCKKWLISTLDKIIYYKGTFLQGSTKPHKIGWRPAEKNRQFFQHASSRSKISMAITFQLTFHPNLAF
jgi:hypothetical protein